MELQVSQIKPYTKNAKKHPRKQIEQIANSIKEFGFNQPIVIDEDSVVIIGHARLEAAKELGMEKVPVLKIDLDKTKAKAYRLADNKLNESDWDMNLVIEELKELNSEGFDIDLTGFDRDLLVGPDEKDDLIPENVPAIAKLGDIWQLGRHRVVCGDSTKKEDVEKLMDGKKADMVFTDPPYNTGMKPKGDSSWMSHIFADALTEEEYTRLVTDSVNNCFDNTKSDYKFTYELIVVGKKGKPKIENRHGLDYQDIWRVQRRIGRNEEHATAKPIELCEKPLVHASKQDDIVLDSFLGSGSTLIACEKTNRICYGMEIDPKCVDVIIKRWEDYTNGNATRIV